MRMKNRRLKPPSQRRPITPVVRLCWCCFEATTTRRKVSELRIDEIRSCFCNSISLATTLHHKHCRRHRRLNNGIGRKSTCDHRRRRRTCLGTTIGFFVVSLLYLTTLYERRGVSLKLIDIWNWYWGVSILLK